jgi:hypothetical protein
MAEKHSPPTLRHRLKQLATKVARIQPLPVHSCGYCVQLPVTLPDEYPPQITASMPLKGLSLDLMLKAADNGCLLSTDFRPRSTKEHIPDDLRDSVDSDNPDDRHS